MSRNRSLHPTFTHIALLTSVLLATTIHPGSALRFYLHDRERRCFKFDAPYSSRVIGTRTIANGRGHAELHIEVKSQSGKTVYTSQTGDSADSKFAFLTPDYFTDRVPDMDDDYDYEPYDLDATYTVCLLLTFDTAMHTANGKRAVTFWIRPDNRPPPREERKAVDWSVGAMNNMLQDTQETLKHIVTDLAALQQRERRLVKRNEATGGRLLFFSIASLVVMLVTAGLQFMHFKTFFKAKKLL